MRELFKIDCPERGCDCHVARVVEEGGRVVLDPLPPRHHGRAHPGRVDLAVVFSKLRRARPD